jgi:hypothetical protein
MLRLLRHGLILGMFSMLLSACAATPTGTQTAAPGASATPATASPTVTGATSTATTSPGPGATATIPTSGLCGTVTQSQNGAVSPPAPGYATITNCLTNTFSACQPSFTTFILQGSNQTRDFTFTVLRKDGICQVYVNDHVQPTNGSETRNFYYCTKAAQSGPKAILSGCDTHFSNGTISIPA